MHYSLYARPFSTTIQNDMNSLCIIHALYMLCSKQHISYIIPYSINFPKGSPRRRRRSSLLGQPPWCLPQPLPAAFFEGIKLHIIIKPTTTRGVKLGRYGWAWVLYGLVWVGYIIKHLQYALCVSVLGNIYIYYTTLHKCILLRLPNSC